MRKQYSAQYHIDENSVLNYYEYYDSKKEKPNLLMLHAQGTDSMSYRKNRENSFASSLAARREHTERGIRTKI